MGRHSAPSTTRAAVGRKVAGLGASALLAAGAATGAAVVAAPAASAADSSAPAGSTLSGPLNELAMGSTPFTNWLQSIVKNIPGIVPGPYIGSTAGPSGSSGMWDWNLKPYK